MDFIITNPILNKIVFKHVTDADEHWACLSTELRQKIRSADLHKGNNGRSNYDCSRLRQLARSDQSKVRGVVLQQARLGRQRPMYIKFTMKLKHRDEKRIVLVSPAGLQIVAKENARNWFVLTAFSPAGTKSWRATALRQLKRFCRVNENAKDGYHIPPATRQVSWDGNRSSQAGGRLNVNMIEVHIPQNFGLCKQGVTAEGRIAFPLWKEAASWESTGSPIRYELPSRDTANLKGGLGS